MARPLQKKKNKSSLPRIRQKPKSKRINIKSNPIVAANWNQSLTLTQNYHRLGLSSKLNAQTGGTEYKALRNSDLNGRRDPLEIPSSKAPKTLGNDEVQVIRDPATGAIIRVVQPHAETHEKRRRKRQNPLNDPLNDLDSPSDTDSTSTNNRQEDASTAQTNNTTTTTTIIPALEASAQSEQKKRRPRLQSQREREWCARLVERWGNDWTGMRRDRGLNPMQMGEGELRRRVRRWKTQGGEVEGEEGDGGGGNAG